MINPILMSELKQYLEKMELINEYPNIYLFLEKTFKTLKKGQTIGL